ncbi:MAG: hydrogenase maturation protease [Candidatus Omnitrophota bacterium]
MFKKTAVIGLGNTLRRDDGIGIIILESLLNNYQRKQVDYLNFGIASFDLMHRLQDYEAVLLIDGISAGLPAGELKIFNLEQAVFPEEANAVSSHELNLKDIFKLTRNLGIKARIYIAGIQVQDTGFGESLSSPLKEKLEALTEQIDSFITGTFLNPKQGRF